MRRYSGYEWVVRDGILMRGRFSVGWNFHRTREVRSFGLAISFAADRVLLLLGPLQLLWLL